MRYRCSACATDFELAQGEPARCPTCLRKTTVRDADEKAALPEDAPGNGRRVVVSILASGLVLFALAVSWLALEQTMLLAGSDDVRGEIVDAHPGATRMPTCSVRYRYVIGGAEHFGSASVAPPCPQGALVVRVSALDPDVSDLGPGLGLLVFLVAPLTIFVAVAASIVALQLWMPESERLRRIAARVGSRYARR